MPRSLNLKPLLVSQGTEYFLEAHSGLSARIASEAGFAGIWASGLSISAAFGVRDSNEASWTQVLEVLEFMRDATSAPILVDGDTGYGNFNNVRRLVHKLGQRKIDGVCIEDKTFPKMNSFSEGSPQQLASIEEFCGKIKAAKDTQYDDSFCVVARTEALIAGYSLDIALTRCHAYREAGADAVLIHSKEKHGNQIREFMRQWDNDCPVILVPTTYHGDMKKDEYEQMGVSVVIWANHMLRSSIYAMQHTARAMAVQRCPLNFESTMAPIHEVFRLQNQAELLEAELRYLPTLAIVDEFSI